jgi:peptidoglycan/LPS O-acetylase OafA/YrhL
LIFRALNKGTFRVSDFYTRRINRILPALIVVLVFCLLAGWVILMPSEYESLGKHTFGGSGFISNVLLWREAGYFDSPDKPLLHLWSLAIEEQFYLVWPAIAIIAWRRKWSVGATLGVIIAVSFASNLWSVHTGRTTAAFYFPGARFWEILSGALLAHIESRSTPSQLQLQAHAAWREAAVAGGIGLLVVSIMSVESSTPWPGWWALAPVAGSFLIIGAGPDTWISRRILGSAILVWIGLISYPMYLWHWPLMVAARLVNAGPVSTAVMITIIAATIVLAWVTYRAIEIPIRFGAHKRRSAAVLLPALAAAGIAGIAVNRGLIHPRLFAASARLDQAKADRTYPSDGGLDRFGGDLVIDSIPGKTGDAVAFIGDSHMQQYWPRVKYLAKARASLPTSLFFTYGSCVPLPGVERRAGNSPLTGKPFECDRFHKLAMNFIRQPRVRTVVYAAAWETYLTNGATFLASDRDVALQPAGTRTDSAFRMFVAEMSSLTAAGKKVFVILPNPVLKAFDPVTMLPPRIPGTAATRARSFVTRREIMDSIGDVSARLRKAAEESGAVVLDPLDVLCDATRCPTLWLDGRPVYRDPGHLSATFVRSRAVYVDSAFTGFR